MKRFDDMTTNEQIDYIVGDLVLSIGKGDFTSCVAKWFMALHQRGYERGKLAAKRKT